MAQSLFEHEQIRTTLPKAKELRSFAEKLITRGKAGDLQARRMLAAVLYRGDVVDKLCGPLALRYKDRPGGYTRIIKCGYRYGDQAPMAIIELVDRDVSAKGKADLLREELRKQQEAEAE